MATYQQHVDGVLAAFNLYEKVAYSRDSLPDVLPPGYIEVSVSRRFGGVQRYSGVRDGRLHRVVARAVGQTLGKAYEMWDLLEAVEETSLLIGGAMSTPVEFETEDEQIAPDAGWYSGSRSLTYALI
jgi:hypothetical protein